MAGFLLAVANPQQTIQTDLDRIHESIEVFERKGMGLDRLLTRNHFTLYLFRKTTISETLFVPMSDDFFVCCTGTMFYKGCAGADALRRIYADHAAGRNLDDALRGHFALIIYSENGLFLMTDFNGYYPVYHDAGRQIYSSSFLAVATAGAPRRLRIHEFYEYILQGFFTGPATYLANVDILRSRVGWRLLPDVATVERRPGYRAIPAAPRFRDLVADIAEQYRAYVETLGRLWPAPIGTALSGGYDTRLMLAMLRRTGIPAYVYVYGSEDDPNVQVARSIARHENVDVEIIDKSQSPRIDIDRFPEQVAQNLDVFDGIHPMGFIDDGTDIQTRNDRAGKAQLQLNGAGGEIYREIWNIGNRSMDLERFLRMRYDIGTYTFLSSAFDADSYFRTYVRKVKDILNIERDWIDRREIEQLFPYLRNMFAAPTNGVNCQISDSLIPFMEPCFTLPSYDLPIQFKYAGHFEAKLIEYFDPGLASHPNEYGFGFTGQPPIKHRLKRTLERHIPLGVRLAKRRAGAAKPAAPHPYYLGPDYLNRIVDTRDMHVGDLIHVDAITDPETLNRTLSAELVCRRVAGAGRATS